MITHPWKRKIIFSATCKGDMLVPWSVMDMAAKPAHPPKKSNPFRVSIESWWPLNNTERKSHFWSLHPGLQLSMWYCWRTKCCITWADINSISNECNMFSPSELVNRMYLWTDCIQMGFFPQSKLDRFFEKVLPSKSLVQKVGGAW